MSPLNFYRQQAAEQQSAAEGATLDNVRERRQRAASAWSALATRSERAEDARAIAASAKLSAGPGENSDPGSAAARVPEAGD